VVQVVTRHPLSQGELELTLVRRAAGRVPELLEQLEASGRVRKVKRGGTVYWVAARSHFPDPVPGTPQSVGVRA
jgi:hypothetical protein